MRKAKQLEEATRKEQNANSKELRNELAKTANDYKREELKKKETELSEKEASLKRREEVYFEKFDNLKEIEEADREYLESIKYDYSRLKNVTSMKDVEIARLNGELKVTKGYVKELKIMEGAWIKTRDGILVQAGSFEYYQEMEELKRCHGSYAKNPTPQNVENMVDAFFSGLKNLFTNLENWFMNMTPGYLRKRAPVPVKMHVILLSSGAFLCPVRRSSSVHPTLKLTLRINISRGAPDRYAGLSHLRYARRLEKRAASAKAWLCKVAKKQYGFFYCDYFARTKG